MFDYLMGGGLYGGADTVSEKRTPGPWRIEQDQHWPFRARIKGSAEWPILVQEPYTVSTSDKTASQANAREDNATWLSNLALIAAAPELLEACKEWVEIDGPYVSLAQQRDRWKGVVDKMKAAIAKAEGTAPEEEEVKSR